MRNDLPSALVAEMNSLVRRPYSKVTVERYLPEWVKVAGGDTPRYHSNSHTACTNGTVIFRARCKSTGGIETVAVNPGSPSWDGWVAVTGVSDMTTAVLGVDMASVWDADNNRFCLFYVNNNVVYAAGFDTAGAYIAGTNAVVFTGSTANATVCQIGAALPTELFVLCNKELEAAIDALSYVEAEPIQFVTKPVFGSIIYRATKSGTTWSSDTSDDAFPFFCQAEGGPMHDDAEKTTSTEINTQLGYVPNGGLSVNQVGDDTVVVGAGMTFWRRWGYDTHSQGLTTFIFHRKSALWERGSESGVADYATDLRMEYEAYARGSIVDGNNFIVWNRTVEPADFAQTPATISMPRMEETVIAKIDSTGRNLTQFQYLSTQDLTSAVLIKIGNHIYAIGYDTVLRSPLAAFICDVPESDRVQISDYCTGWKVDINNRFGMSINIPLQDASILFGDNPIVKAGALCRVYAGTEADYVQIAQGWIDYATPSISVVGRDHKATLVARADKMLKEIKAESIEDILPQSVVTEVVPANQNNAVMKNIAFSAGKWDLRKGGWDDLYLNEAYGMGDKYTYRLESFPYAQTGGDDPDTVEVNDGPGSCLTEYRPEYMGSWFKDVAWLNLPSMVDGMVQSSIRFGHNLCVDESPETFFYIPRYDNTNTPNGSIARGTIRWCTYSNGAFGDTTTNRAASTGIVHDIYLIMDKPGNKPDAVIEQTANQYALMGGLICHSRDIGKKYSFIWECDTRFDRDDYGDNASSHTRDTWKKENFDSADYRIGRGSNRLYLLVSDYLEYGDNYNDMPLEPPPVPIEGETEVSDTIAMEMNCAVKMLAISVTPGRPIDLKMQVVAGTIYCFYRAAALKDQTPGNWTLAFKYHAGRFGAGKFGIVGRGHAGVFWDALWPGREYLSKYDNNVDFWNIGLTDCQKDKTLEDVLRQYSWLAHTPARFKKLSEKTNVSLTNASSTFVNASSIPVPTENTVIDFTVAIQSGEAGVFLRGVDPSSPLNTCIKIGIVVGTNTEGNPLACYIVKRLTIGGVAQPETDYSAIPIRIETTTNIANAATWKPIPARVTVRDNIYSIWIAGVYCGHFVDSTHLGLYSGIYATGTALFIDASIPELYEVPEYALLDVNQQMDSAIKKVIGQRRIKGVYQWDGSILYSYFDETPAQVNLEDSLVQSSLSLNDRFYSRCTVEGAYTKATYAPKSLLAKGERYTSVHMPDIYHHEHCFREAKAIVRDSIEQAVQGQFVGLPDYRIQPEDGVVVTVAQQAAYASGEHLVEGVSFEFKGGDKPNSAMSIDTRQRSDVDG